MAKTLPQELYDKLWQTMRAYAPKSLSWNHYDLAVETDVNDTELWKTFLTLPEVAEWLDEERALLQKYELAKMTTDVASSRSVGQAQMISAVNKLYQESKENAATGPAYIYCYIPLNKAQEHAPNVKMLEEDIFFEPDDTIKFDDGSSLPT